MKQSISTPLNGVHFQLQKNTKMQSGVWYAFIFGLYDDSCRKTMIKLGFRCVMNNNVALRTPQQKHVALIISMMRLE